MTNKFKLSFAAIALLASSSSLFVLNSNVMANLSPFPVTPPVTPSYTATPTATSVPTPVTPPTTPTTTPSASVKPTPITAPTVNKKPHFKTGFLGIAHAKKSYFTKIAGFDKNIGDTLKIQAQFPGSVMQKTCASFTVKNSKEIVCTYGGVINKAGIHIVNATIQDNHGTSTKRAFILLVLPR